MIATYVSWRTIAFIAKAATSIAAQLLGGSDADYDLITQIKQNYEDTPLSPK
jgi:hypothetical protein